MYAQRLREEEASEELKAIDETCAVNIWEIEKLLRFDSVYLLDITL